LRMHYTLTLRWVAPVLTERGSIRLQSWLALLELRARYAADLAAKAAGLPVSHSEEELEGLLKGAMRYSSEIDSGNIDRWH
jgi:hypothetical protein